MQCGCNLFTELIDEGVLRKPMAINTIFNEIHIVIESMLEDMDDFTCTPIYKKKKKIT
jgi:hypothetical protein